MSRFTDFTDEFSNIAAEWPTYSSALTLDEEHYRHEIRRYERTGGHILSLVRQSNSWPAPLMTPGGIDHGVRVLMRYMYYGAASGKLADLALNDVAVGLKDDRSFDPLDDIARNPARAAKSIELPLGLLNHQNGWSCINQYRWEPSDTGAYLTIPALQEITTSVYSEQGVSPFDDRMCQAHRQDALRPIYRALINIAELDNRLLAQTLSPAQD